MKMMNHTEILTTAASTLRERGRQYGPVELCFDRASKLASIRLNKTISMYDVAIIMSCVKQARQTESPTLVDSFVDDVNYTAIAGQFAAAQFETIEDDIVAMAKRFAPKRESLNAENNSNNNGGNADNNRVDQPAGG
jgi:hypothetical protein